MNRKKGLRVCRVCFHSEAWESKDHNISPSYCAICFHLSNYREKHTCEYTDDKDVVKRLVL